MAILLLLLVLSAAMGAFMMLVAGFMLLMALGTTHAVAGLLFLYGLLSALGGLALSALSPRLLGTQWGWSFATLWMAVALALEFGLTLAIVLRQH